MQAVDYHPGLGTMEAPGALLRVSRRLSRIGGLVFGSGFERDVRDAYDFLMKNVEVGDHIFLFGFSRSAYTARAVASLLLKLPAGAKSWNGLRCMIGRSLRPVRQRAGATALLE